jgi:hypothetical protein
VIRPTGGRFSAAYCPIRYASPPTHGLLLGMHEAGVPRLGHFPGHGSSRSDSHRASPT